MDKKEKRRVIIFTSCITANILMLLLQFLLMLFKISDGESITKCLIDIIPIILITAGTVGMAITTKCQKKKE